MCLHKICVTIENKVVFFRPVVLIIYFIQVLREKLRENTTFLIVSDGSLNGHCRSKQPPVSSTHPSSFVYPDQRVSIICSMKLHK